MKSGASSDVLMELWANQHSDLDTSAIIVKTRLAMAVIYAFNDVNIEIIF